MGDQNDNLKYLQESKFDKFIKNDFDHLKSDVSVVKAKLNYTLGMMAILVPLVVATLGIVIGLAFVK